MNKKYHLNTASNNKTIPTYPLRFNESYFKNNAKNQQILKT